MPASMLHPTVQLAERLARAPQTTVRIGPLSPDELSLERARQAPDDILATAKQLQRKFKFGSSIFGGWVGLVVGVKLISLSLRRWRTDYEPDRGECFACARCFEYCPNELVRRGLPPPATALSPACGNAYAGLSSPTQPCVPASHQVKGGVTQIFNLLYRRFLTCWRP